MDDPYVFTNEMMENQLLEMKIKAGPVLYRQFRGAGFLANTTQFFVRLWHGVPLNLLIY